MGRAPTNGKSNRVIPMVDYERHLTANFRLKEFRCRCGCEIPEIYISRLQAVAEVLQTYFRDSLGPVEVTSGYRCRDHNVTVGGTPYSQHTVGRAADIKVAPYAGMWLAGWAESQVRDGRMPEGGIGTYGGSRANILHVDLRGIRTRWHHK